jgi:hypothetical protein
MQTSKLLLIVALVALVARSGGSCVYRLEPQQFAMPMSCFRGKTHTLHAPAGAEQLPQSRRLLAAEGIRETFGKLGDLVSLSAPPSSVLHACTETAKEGS